MTYSCAFRGEDDEVFADPGSGRRQTFTEDYTVCCRPNLIALVFDDDGDVDLDVQGVRVTAACATPPLPGGARRQRFGALLFGSL